MKLKMLAQLSEELELVDRYTKEYLVPVEENGKTAEIMYHLLGAPGKRLRPQLLLLAGRLGPDYARKKDRLSKLGALVELVHMASLVHDDIVDDSPLRRGTPTVQARFGKDMAVYTGDLILSQVMHVLFRENMVEAGKELSGTIQDMCRGEIGQLDCCYSTCTSIAQYMRNIYGKTASMFALACVLGGMESGCLPGQVNALRNFGENMGYLFQIQDDVLDFLADISMEGKPDHMDFQSGIFTLPVLYALEEPAFRSSIQKLAVSAKERLLKKVEMSALDRIVLESGGLEKTRRAMEYFGKQAKLALDQLPKNDAVEALGKLLAMLERRSNQLCRTEMRKAAAS